MEHLWALNMPLGYIAKSVVVGGITICDSFVVYNGVFVVLQSC